jgi:hypothetical protein
MQAYSWNGGHPDGIFEMKAIAKIFLHILTLAPLLYIPVFVFLLIMGINHRLDNMNPFIAPITAYWFRIAFFTFPIILVFYIVNVFKNSKMADNQRILWVLLLVFGNVVVSLLNWFMYIWRDRSSRLVTLQKPSYSENE